MDGDSCGSSAKRIPNSGVHVGLEVFVVRNSKRWTKKWDGDGIFGGIYLLKFEWLPDKDDPIDFKDADI